MNAESNSQSSARTVVVGFDGSDSSEVAVVAARDQAGPEGLLIVVYSYGLPPDFLGYAEYDHLLAERQSLGRAALEELAGRHAEALGSNYETELIGGPPAQALIDVAHARHADLVVVGSRGLGRVRGALGSISQRLLTLADLPVLVVPGAGGGA